MMKRYLRYDYPHEIITGSNHQLLNFFAILAEASVLRRVAVVPNLTLAEFHNAGRRIVTPFHKYLDLSECKELVSIVSLEEYASVKIESQQRIPERAPTSSLMNIQSQELVRDFEHAVFVAPMSSSSEVQETFRLLRSLARPSPLIREAAEAVARAITPFNIIHVRRGDMLKQPWWRFPGMNRGTQPHAIRRRIRQWINDGSTLYVMSDETRTGFFDPLGAWYRVFTYRDFPALVQMKTEDNFLLYEVEKALAEKAQVRVEMFSEYTQYGKFEHSLFDYPRTGTTAPLYKGIGKIMAALHKARKRLAQSW
jgi:hypothetical protein